MVRTPKRSLPALFMNIDVVKANSASETSRLTKKEPKLATCSLRDL